MKGRARVEEPEELWANRRMRMFGQKGTDRLLTLITTYKRQDEKFSKNQVSKFRKQQPIGRQDTKFSKKHRSANLGSKGDRRQNLIGSRSANLGSNSHSGPKIHNLVVVTLLVIAETYARH